MLEAEKLAEILTRTPSIAWDGVLYRAVDLEALFGFHHNPPYPGPRPLYSLGAPQHGGRYTPRGGPLSLYMSEENTTALKEASATLPTQDPAHAPKVIYSANVLLKLVLDLTDSTVRQMLGTSLPELSSNDWRLAEPGDPSPTQRLGQAIFDSGRYQAIRFPSTKDSGKACIIIFTDRLTPPSFVEIYDPNGNLKARIPQDRRQ